MEFLQGGVPHTMEGEHVCEFGGGVVQLRIVHSFSSCGMAGVS